MTTTDVLLESLIDWGVVAAQAGASFCTAGVSPPSQSGCLAVESWCDVVLKISYFPVVAASLVFNLSAIHRVEGFGRFECLVEYLTLIDSRNHHRCRKTQRVVKTFDGRHSLAFQDHAVCH